MLSTFFRLHLQKVVDIILKTKKKKKKKERREKENKRGLEYYLVTHEF